MDWQKNRLWIGAVALLVLGGAAIWAVSSRTGDTPASERDVPRDFPEIERDDVAVLEITRPEDDQTIRLERRDDTWRITQPIEAPADQSAVTTALDKLDELEVAGVAASAAQFHERLEVDAEHGVRVVARGADGEALADLWIGAYRSGNTMVRVEGQDRVVSVRGSIKFAFNKELRDWRNRAIVDLESDDVREVSWVGPNGTFRFTRPETAAEAPPAGEAGEGEAAPAGTQLGDWQPTEISYVPPAPEAPAETPAPGKRPPTPPPAPTAQTSIEGFAPSKVRSMVASLARMRASDFAAADVTAESAGITDASPRVTLTAGTGDERQTATIVLGSEANAERHDFYAMREGDPTIYVVSRFLSERIHPTAVAFTQSAPPSTPEPAPGGEGGEGGAIQMPGGAGGQLPPEVMEQIRRQLEAQGMGGGAGP